MSSADLSQHINLQSNKPNQRRTTFKLVVAGTIALTASVIALSQLPQSGSSTKFMQLSENQDEKQQAFMQFIAKYGKTYASKTDMGSRFEIFSQNFDIIKAHNAQEDSYKMGVNQFTDLSTEEKIELYGKQGL